MKLSKHQKNLRRWQARREMAYSLHYDRGMSFSQIGKRLKVSRQSAAKLVWKEMDRRGER